MQSYHLIGIIVGYFLLLMLIAHFTSKKSQSNSYFDGDKSSPWFLVAFGMIGSGISAVSLVSIPGNVGNENWHYFQFILGTLVGYLFIAFVLIPVFYKQHLVSIYTYLQNRFGNITYKTGSLFFIVSQSFGAALRLLLSVKILQVSFLDQMGVPYYISIIVVLIAIWLYTNKAGVKTIVWTDALQSLMLITVIVISIVTITNALHIQTTSIWSIIQQQPTSKIFNFNFNDSTNFYKQFIAGFLITVALVGLDQSMMQKTLTIKESHHAKKNVLSFSFFIAMAQTLFLGLGVLLYLFASKNNIILAKENGLFVNTDTLYPLLTMHYFGKIGIVAFFIGVVASTFATIDACITALTTSISFDFFNYSALNDRQKKSTKNKVLVGVNIIQFIIVMAFWNSKGAIITTIFTIAGYTYGPLLGLYLVGLFTKWHLQEKWVPIVCVMAPIVTYLLSIFATMLFQFDFGFMNILVNASITILLLKMISSTNHDN
jgi:Na+/proline symporter